MSFFAMGQLFQGRAVYSKKKHVFVVKLAFATFYFDYNIFTYVNQDYEK